MTGATDVRAPIMWIDVAKVAGIVGVVIIHVTGLTWVRGAPEDSFTSLVAGAVDLAMVWSVPAFVAASGAALLGRPPAAGGLRRRLRRIVPPLVVWHVAYIAFARFELGWFGSWDTLAEALWSGRVYTALYFFWVILGLYIITPLLARGLRSLSPRGTWVVAVLAVTAVWAAAYLGSQQGGLLGDVANGGLAVTQFVPFLGFYITGLALRRSGVPRRALPAILLVAVVSGALRIAAGLDAGVRTAVAVTLPGTYHGIGSAVFAIAVLACIVALTDQPQGQTVSGPTGTSTWLRRWSGRTLGIFAVHLLVLYVLQRLTGTWPNGATTLWSMTLLTLATLVISMLVTAGLGRLPLVRRLV